MKISKARIKSTFLLMLCFVIVGIAFSVVLFLKDNNRTYASATLSFSYDGAAEGLAPNGYSFDVNDISCEEVLTDALSKAGMSYTVEEIQPNLVAQGVYPEDLVTRMTSYSSIMEADSSRQLALAEYHPTVFNVTLYNDFDNSISKSALTGLLGEILSSYREYFGRIYSMGTIDGVDIDTLGTYDYFQEMEILDNKLEQSTEYADEMGEVEPSPLISGKGFSDISMKLSQLKNTDLPRLNATMTMNSLSKNLERMEEQYQFEIRELQNQITIQNNRLESLDELIATYGKSGVIYLSTSEALNKVDTKSSKIYDELVDLRNEVSDSIASLNNQIATYQKKLDELGSGEEPTAEDDSGTADSPKTADEEISKEETQAMADEVTVLSDASYDEQRAVLDTGIDRLIVKTNDTIDQFTEMVGTYNTQEINELTVIQSGVKYKKPSFISGAFIKKMIKVGGPFIVLGMMLVLVLLIIRRKKRVYN